MRTLNRHWQSAMMAALLGGLAITGWSDTTQTITAADPTLISLTGSGDSLAPILSADGRYVLFASLANNLTPPDGTNQPGTPFPPRLNAFVRDRTNGTTTLVSVSPPGVALISNSWPRAISANGRYVLFESRGNALILGISNRVAEVFVRDLVAGTTELVNRTTNGARTNAIAQDSVMTPDGRFVAFSSTSANLVPNDTNGIRDVFLRDRQLGTTVLVSVGAMPTNTFQPTASSDLPDITPDGRYVAFLSTATNLVPGVQTVGEVYLRDLVTHTTYLASTNARAAAFAAFHTSNVLSCNHVLSADGRYVAFEATPLGPTNINAGVILRYNRETGGTDVVHTNADGVSLGASEIQNLDMTPEGRFIAFVANATGNNGTTTAVYLWDAAKGTTTLASGDLSNQVPPNSTCTSPIVEANGQFVIFVSNAPNLTSNNVPPGFHIYRRDLLAGVTALVDVNTSGAGAVLTGSVAPSVGADGRLVAFESRDPSLTPGDHNAEYDVFVRDLTLGTTELISVRHPSFPSLSGNGPSLLSSLCASSNGQFAVFASDADNLTPNDSNGCRDIFLKNLGTGVATLVSVSTNGFAAAGNSTEPVISGDGRYVAFASTAGDIVANTRGATNQVYLRDLMIGSTSLVSVRPDGSSPGDGPSHNPILRADGGFIHFLSQAQNLVPGVFSRTDNLYSRDLQTGVTYGLTTGGVVFFAASSDGRFLIFRTNTLPVISIWDSATATLSYHPNIGGAIANGAISRDGNRIVYIPSSSPFQLVAADLAANTDIMIGSLGSPPTTQPYHVGPRFNDDGRFVVYVSRAGTATDVNNLNDIYLYDFDTGTNLLVSRSFNTNGAGNGTSDSPEISGNGRFITYRSFASNLVPGDNNGQPDLFLYDRLSGSTILLSVNTGGNAAANFRSQSAFLSGDGSTVLLQSWGSDLAALDYNARGDLFAFKLFNSTNPPPPLETGMFFVSVPGQGNSSLSRPSVTWSAMPGAGYQVQYKDDLSEPLWHDLPGSSTIVGSQGRIIDLAPNPNQRFYRLFSY